MLVAKALEPLQQRTGSKVGTSTHDQPRGLSTGMRINYPNSLAFSNGHESVRSPMFTAQQSANRRAHIS